MNVKFILANAAVIGGVLAMAGAALAAPDTKTGSDQNLRYTRAYLDRADDMLSRDQRDYGGHRAAAMKEIDEARGDLTSALQFDKEPDDAVKPTDVRPDDNDIANILRGQGASNENIENVKTIVERSIANLQSDAHDYGGFRVKAVASLESARDQLADAIEFREAHSGSQESAATASDENLRFTRLYVERAVDMLQHDQHDYAGHRVSAISDIQSAQADLAQALKLDAVKEDGVLPAHMRPEDSDLDNFFQRGQFASDQNIVFVRRTVERAIDMLQADQHDYNGFRVKAIDNLERARQQLLLALQSR